MLVYASCLWMDGQMDRRMVADLVVNGPGASHHPHTTSHHTAATLILGGGWEGYGGGGGGEERRTAVLLGVFCPKLAPRINTIRPKAVKLPKTAPKSGESQGSHRGVTEESQRSHRGVTEESQRRHR